MLEFFVCIYSILYLRMCTLCCNLAVSVSMNVRFTTNGVCAKT